MIRDFNPAFQCDLAGNCSSGFVISALKWSPILGMAALVRVAIGEKFRDLAKLSFPLFMDYAERHHLDICGLKLNEAALGYKRL